MLFAILAALMLAATIIDGWSQHKMLQKPGNYEVSAIYGKHPTYGRYFEINLPVLAAAIVWLVWGHFYVHLQLYWLLGVGFCGWHAYGTWLNWKLF